MRFQDYRDQAPDTVALIDPDEKAWTRAELAAKINSLSRALIDRDLKTADTLAIVAPNCAEYLIAYLAATQVGLYVAPINGHLTGPEIAYILDDCGAKVLVAHERFTRSIKSSLEIARAPPPVRFSIGTIAGFEPLDDVIVECSSERLDHPVSGRMLAYTSATTGRPKGVRLPIADADRALDTGIRARESSGTRTCEHVYLCTSVLHHGAPLETAYIAMHMGNAVVLPDAPSPEDLLRLIDKYRVTMAFMVPSTFVRLLRLPSEVRQRYTHTSLKRVLHTGAPCSVDVKQKMIDWWGPIFWEAYAGAEGGGTLASCQDWMKYPGTVGRPIPGSDIKIFDDRGLPLAHDQVGTVYMTRFSGDRFEYLGDPSKTESAYIGGYFTMGDRGYLNKDGYLFLLGRQSDMIISYGTNVYPAEIEEALMAHPGVRDCAAFGIPHKIAGEAIVAVIQVQDMPADIRLLTAEIIQSVSKVLSTTKLPKRIKYTIDSIREPTGKLRKDQLRARYFDS